MRRVILASAISMVVGIVGTSAVFLFLAPKRPSDEAVQAVQALTSMRSVTSVGVTYQNYLTRVADTKIVVDRYLESPDRGDAALRRPVGLALDYYVAAAAAWSAKNQAPADSVHEWEKLAQHMPPTRDPEFLKCPPVQLILEQADIYRRGVYGLHAIEYLSIPPFWGCAKDKLVEAGSLLTAKRK